MNLSTRASINLSGPQGLQLLGRSVRSENVDAFGVRGTSWGFDDVRLTEILLSSVRYSAPSHDPLREPDDTHVALAIVLDGTIRVHTPASDLYFGPGTGMLFNPRTLPKFFCPGRARILHLTLPDKKVTGPLTQVGFRPLSSSTIRTQPLLPFCNNLIRTASTHSVPADPTAAILANLIGRFLAADQQPDQFIYGGAIAEIQAHVREHFTDTILDETVLARAFGVSVQDLDKLISSHLPGSNLANLIAEHRLAHAITLLPSRTDLTIAEVAQRSGYPTPEALDAALIAGYGVSAAQLRASQHNPSTTPTHDDALPRPARHGGLSSNPVPSLDRT